MIDELEALVILTSIPNLGAVRIKQLIQHFGSAKAILETDSLTIAGFHDFGKQLIPHWGNWKKDRAWRENLELVEKFGVTLISYTDPRYPKRLLEIPDHPVLLYTLGELQPRDQNSIAVVGTRQASIYGRELAERVSQQLAEAGYSVVSGLARGIDTAAHSGAVRKGRTIAVIGSGLANIYPRENILLADLIAENGALISEFTMKTPPDRQNFPQRNRIVSGMAEAAVLIEAPLQSGAMLTMERARQYNRGLFAFPGRVDSEDFRGNHSLIKNGHAILVENAQDILSSLGDFFGTGSTTTKPSPKRSVVLTKEEENLLKLLPNQEICIDKIMQLTQLPIMKVNALLMELLLKRLIKEYPGKTYKKLEL